MRSSRATGARDVRGRLVQKRMPMRSSGSVSNSSGASARREEPWMPHLASAARHVVIVVVVAENGEHAVRRGER